MFAMSGTNSLSVNSFKYSTKHSFFYSVFFFYLKSRYATSVTIRNAVKMFITDTSSILLFVVVATKLHYFTTKKELKNYLYFCHNIPRSATFIKQISWFSSWRIRKQATFLIQICRQNIMTSTTKLSCRFSKTSWCFALLFL